MKRFFCFLLYAGLLNSAAANEIVAFINKQKISTQDIVHYARQSPLLVTYLDVPGGPLRILNNMIAERLLLLEGERLGIAKPKNENHSLAYVLKVRKELVGQYCPKLDQIEAKKFYDEHPDLFSTPLLLRLSRIGLPFDGNTESVVRDKLLAIEQDIKAKKMTFAEAARKYSQDKLGKDRGGDIGFEPITDLQNPVFELMNKSAKNEIIGPVQEQNMLYLYQVTDRREPILEPYETARMRAAEEQRKYCQQQTFNKVMAELKQRWNVEILVDDISVRPETP